MAVHEMLTEEECALHTILSDPSGLDLAEFAWVAAENDDLCFRAWPYQWAWWKNSDPLQIDQNARSTGKSLSIKVRLCAFAFVHPGQEALITAPELNHLDPIVKLIETQIDHTRLLREMRKRPATHRPFFLEMMNGARIIGAIPQKTGVGVKGKHPVWLEQDEACFVAGTLILTNRGLLPIEKVSVGDRVFTHKDRWRTVLRTHVYERPTITLKGHGCPEIGTTANHHFWAQSLVEPDWRKRGGPREFMPPSWVPAHQMEGAFWSSPASFPNSEIPPCEVRGSRELACDVTSTSFAWILGLYLAEGSLSSALGAGRTLNRVWFSIHEDEVDEVQRRLTFAGLHSRVDYLANSKGANVSVTSQALARWIKEQVPGSCREKQIPTWLLGAADDYRQAVLDGIIYGDGCSSTDKRYAPGRMRLSTTSHALAVSARILGSTLSYQTCIYWSPPPKRRAMIRGKEFQGGDSYEVIFAEHGYAKFDDSKVFTKAKQVTPRNAMETVYDLEVEDDHSFVANGIVVHNSDYPEPGWTELIETLNTSDPDHVWRSHGVTRGLRDSFYRNSIHAEAESALRPLSHTDEGRYTVHKVPAMARPTWSDEEREAKIKQYGSREDPDYRRNVLGAHGDSQSPLFVMSRLGRVIDDDPSSDYNTDDYYHLTIKDSELVESRMDIVDYLDPPSLHTRYKTVWMGMDVGYTIDPSEILIAAEYPMSTEEKRSQLKGKAIPIDGASRLKIIGRITLKRISEPDQASMITALIDFYHPQVFAMDSTGNGLPLFQQIQRRMQDAADVLRSARARKAAQSVKGYNFSQKLLVDFDDTVEVDDDAGIEERVREAGIHRLVIEYSTDILRTYVDEGRLWLPWDRDLIGQFQGQTYSLARGQITEAGARRRIFSQGDFHALDAARMLALGHKQHSIEALLAVKEEREPVLDAFMGSDAFFGGSERSEVMAW